MTGEDRIVPASQKTDGKVNGKISRPMPASVCGLAPPKVSRLETKEIDDLGKKVTVQIEVESDDGQGSESDSDGSEGALTVEEVTALTEIKIIQKELDKHNDQCLQEIEKVEQKFMAIKQPMIELRDKQIEKVNYFWLKTFLKHSKLYALIKEEEKPALTYLSKVEVQEFPTLGIGYKMRFSFEHNPYFTNQMFEKVFNHDEDDELVQKPVIDWKEGMNFMDGLKGKGFFHWLIDAPDSDTQEFYDEIADAIKEDIWPDPTHYFFKNNADDEEDEEGFVLPEDEAEEEAEEEEEDDDDGGETEVFDLTLDDEEEDTTEPIE